MPSSRDDEWNESEDDFYLQFNGIDEDGNPYVNPDEFNLLFENEQFKWYEQMQEHIVEMYKLLQNYPKINGLQILDQNTFNNFAVYVAQNSTKMSTSYPESYIFSENYR